MFGLLSSKRHQKLAEHIVATAIASPDLVVSTIVEVCPDFNHLFDGNPDEWARIWSAICIFDAIMRLSAKIAPKDLESTMNYVEVLVRDAPKLGFLGNERFKEWMTYYAANKPTGLQRCIGSWVLEKSENSCFQDKGPEYLCSLGRGIMSQVAELHRDL